MDDDDMVCPECGKGRTFSDATFEEDERRIRWTMWSCGHCARTIADGRETSSHARDLKRHAPITIRA